MPVYVVTEAMAEEVTGFHVHRGALASLHREVRHTVADLLTAERLVVIEDVVDHTNVGRRAAQRRGPRLGRGSCWRRGRPTRSTAGRSR